MTLLRDVPIRRKIEAVILVTSAVVLSLSLVLLLVLDLTSLRAELQIRLQGLADVLGANSTAALAFNDERTANEILATLNTQPEVVRAAILRDGGELFAQYRAPGFDQMDFGALIGSGRGLLAELLVVDQPIILDGDVLGHIRIVGDMRPGHATLRQHSYLVLSVFGLSMLLAFVLSKRLQRIISAPIERLLTTMNTVAETTDFSCRAERLGNDELGALVDSFNAMLDRLERNRQQLDAYRHLLEQRVRERTDDLEQRTRELMRRTSELERMNTELEEFAYVASHDLKAPLRAVANLALVVEEDAGGRLDDDNRRLLGLMRERVIAMDALIDGLLSYARIGRAERHTSAVDLGSLVSDIVASLALPAGFSVDLAPQLPSLVADPVEMRQVFQNLVANAASHHDRPAQGHVTISASACEGYWCVEVADDGPGIPVHMRDEVFRMFSTGRASGHTGIGLAVVRKIVSANGGRVAISDNTPRGTVFRIEWPMER